MYLVSLVLALSWLNTESDAGTAPPPEPLRQSRLVTLAPGESRDEDVGAARGFVCDDTSIVSADVREDNGRNSVHLKALREGKTLCRAGSDALGGARVFLQISVQASDAGESGETP